MTLFVCMFVWSCKSNSRIFHSYGDFVITDDQFTNFDLLSILMVIEQWGLFNVHVTSATMVISVATRHSNLLPSVWQWICHYFFNDLLHARRTLYHYDTEPIFWFWDGFTISLETLHVIEIRLNNHLVFKQNIFIDLRDWCIELLPLWG